HTALPSVSPDPLPSSCFLVSHAAPTPIYPLSLHDALPISFLEKFSRWYTPAVMISAILVGLITHNTELALTLLVIGCPGALVISIPVSIVAGIGRAARDGILIKGGECLAQAAKVDAVVVDKPGTLTLGRPALTDVRTLPDSRWSEEEILGLAADVESASEHPLAAA